MSLAKRLLRTVSTVGALVLLSSCGATEKVTRLFEDPIVLACPDSRILADAAELISYAEGGGRDLTDVNVEGQIDNIALACLTKIDRDTRIGVMEVEVGLNFVATRGPANKTRQAIFPYFISVTDLEKNVLYREQFEVAVDFSGNRTKFGFRNTPITIELPLKPDVGGKSYLVYTGFVLTKEQLQANRIRRSQGEQ